MGTNEKKCYFLNNYFLYKLWWGGGVEFTVSIEIIGE